jgi:hypothetical protein
MHCAPLECIGCLNSTVRLVTSMTLQIHALMTRTCCATLHAGKEATILEHLGSKAILQMEGDFGIVYSACLQIW